MTQDTIPTGPLQLDEWQQELAQLATRAEQLSPDCSLQSRLSIAADWFRLLWLSCDPAWIAQSCRLASRLAEPVMAMPAGVDQQVLSSWDARRAALKSVGALTKDLGPGPVADPSLIGKPIGRPPRPKPEPEPAVAAAVATQHANIRDRIKAEPVAPRVLRPRSERMGARPAPPAPEPPAEPEQAPVPAGWDCEPEQVAPEPAPAPEQHGWGGEIVAPDPAPAPATISALELASWWGLSVSWVHSLHRRGVLELGTHYRKHQRGEPKGNHYFPDPTHQAIAVATGRPIPPAPLQTVEECLQPRRQRRVLAEQVLAQLQGAPAVDGGDGWVD